MEGPKLTDFVYHGEPLRVAPQFLSTPGTGPVNCPECGKPMELKIASDYLCFACDATSYGWQCSDCRLCRKTGCPHVEAQPPDRILTEEEFRERLKAAFERVR